MDNMLSSGPDDQYMVATMVDIVPGSSSFSIANSRYEAGAAANIRTDKFGVDQEMILVKHQV